MAKDCWSKKRNQSGNGQNQNGSKASCTLELAMAGRAFQKMYLHYLKQPWNMAGFEGMQGEVESAKTDAEQVGGELKEKKPS